MSNRNCKMQRILLYISKIIGLITDCQKNTFNFQEKKQLQRRRRRQVVI